MDLIRFPSSAPDTDPFPWVSNFLSEIWKVLKVETWIYSRERVGVFNKRRREGDLNPGKNLYRKCKTFWIVKVGESYKEKIKKIFFYQAMAVDDVVFGDLGRVPIPVHFKLNKLKLSPSQ